MALAMAHCVRFMSACVWQESGMAAWVECLQYSMSVCFYVIMNLFVCRRCVAQQKCVCVRVFVFVCFCYQSGPDDRSSLVESLFSLA